MSEELSEKINDILKRELQSLATSILEKQCVQMGIDCGDIEPEDLPVLAHKLSEMMRTLGGYDKAKRVYSEITRLRDLDELAEEDMTDEARQDMLENLAKASLFAAEWEKAQKYFDRLLAEAEKNNDVLQKSRYLRWLGIMYKDRAEFEPALALLEKALAAAIEYGASNQTSKCHCRIGDIHWYRGDYDKAQKSYTEAIEKGKGDDIGIAHIGMGNVYGSRKDLNKALEHYQEALTYVEGTDNLQAISRAHNNIGDTYLQLEDWDNALAHFSKGESIGEEGGCLNITAFTKFNMGEVLVKKGELDKAKELLDASLETLKEIDSKPGLAGAYHVYGLLYRVRKDWDNMIMYYLRAIEMYSDIDIPLYTAKCMYELGEGYRDMGEDQKAQDEFKRALRVYQHLKVESMIALLKGEIDDA